MDFSSVVPDVVSNLVSAAITFMVVAVLWPARRDILAWTRALLPVRGVLLYLSFDRASWNIEVPNEYVNDVKWRLRSWPLLKSSEIRSMTADEDSQTFHLQIAAYDQTYADDVHDITAMLKKHRIAIHPFGDISGPHASGENDVLFG